MNKKSTMSRGCRFGIAVAMATLLGLVSGCIGFKTGPEETNLILQKRELVSYSIFEDNGITAKISFKDGNAMLSMRWWPKVSKKFKFHYDENHLIYGTTRIGFFPGVETDNSITKGQISGIGWCLLMNLGMYLAPTIGSLVVEPFIGYGDGNSLDFCAFGLIGCYNYRDRYEPKLIWSKEVIKDMEKSERYSWSISDFEIEVKGRNFKGDEGVAYLGSHVQPGDAVTIKIMSITPPQGFSIEDVKRHIGSQIELKTPTWSDLARSDEAAAARLASTQAAEAQAQQVAAEAAALDAAQQAATISAVTSAIQGMNAAAMAISTPTPTHVSTPIRTTPAVSTPTASHSTYQPKTIPKYTIVPRAPSFGLSNGTSSDSGTRYKTGLQRVR